MSFSGGGGRWTSSSTRTSWASRRPPPTCWPRSARRRTSARSSTTATTRPTCGRPWAAWTGPGWPSRPSDGGVGASAVELAIVVEQLGYVGDPTPFLATTTQFVPLVAACGDAEQRSRFLGAVAAEGQAGTLALAGPNGRWDPHAPAGRGRSASGRRLAAARHRVVRARRRPGRRAGRAGPHRRGRGGLRRARATPSGSRGCPPSTRRCTSPRSSFDGVEVGDDRRLAWPATRAAGRRSGPSTRRSPAWR